MDKPDRCFGFKLLRSLRFKILFVAAALVLLCQVVTVSAVLYIANRDITARAGTSLLDAADVLQQSLESEARQLESTAKALAADFGFKRAVGTQDSATIESALFNHARRAGADVAMLVDIDGRLIARVGSHPMGDPQLGIPPGTDISDPIHHVVQDDTHAYRAVTVPVLAPLPIAGLNLGFRIDSAYVAHLEELSGFTVTAVLNDGGRIRALAGNLPEAAEALEDASFAGAASAAQLEIAGGAYLALPQRLNPTSDSVQLLLTQSLDDAMAPYNLLRSAAFVLGAIPLIAALFGAAFFSRTLTRPVQKLLSAALRIQSGDYSQPVAVRSGDELHQFAVAFNSMQDEIARREERIGHQARHDSVTGLYNRDHALSLLDAAIDKPDCERLAVLLVRLNGHHAIAETLGHDVADDYLGAAGAMLRQVIGDDTTLARTDGDTFLLVAGHKGITEARHLADDILSRLQAGVRLPDANVAVNPTIGIAVYPQHGRDHDALLLHAYVAVSASTEHRRPVRVYREGDEQQRRRNMALLQDLVEATQSNHLQLHYQPKIRVSDETVCGVEALVRWNHPVFGHMPPAQFIPVLEQSGKISILTRWAIQAAISQQQAWLDEGLELDVAINFSAQDLHDNDLPWFLMDTLHEHGVAPERIIAEVTEEAMVRDFTHTTAVLRRIRELGVRVAVDDFGTGYSSLSHLKNLPVDELKIDRCFISNLTTDAADTAIVKTTVELAQRLRLKTVAEGVGNSATLVWLRDNQVDTAQGYYWSEPLQPQALREWIAGFKGGSTRQSRKLEVI